VNDIGTIFLKCQNLDANKGYSSHKIVLKIKYYISAHYFSYGLLIFRHDIISILKGMRKRLVFEIQWQGF